MGLLRYGFVEYEGRESIDIGMLLGDAGDSAVIFDSEVERAALCVREGNDVTTISSSDCGRRCSLLNSTVRDPRSGNIAFLS